MNTDLRPGTTATVYAQVQPVVDETMLANNERSMDYAIVGAYDPNDKQVSPRGRPEDDLTPVAEREFTYTVRFQNTGNYPATRVHITDTLHPLLDASSLRLVYSSHNVDAFVYQGVLHLDHQGIMLPDSTSDPEGSQGMVVFALRAIPAADLNDAITNTANIYFDLSTLRSSPIPCATYTGNYSPGCTRFRTLVRSTCTPLQAETMRTALAIWKVGSRHCT